MSNVRALNRAIRLCGGISTFAKRIGVSPQAVNKWRRVGLTPERAVDIEFLTGGEVSRRDLLPAFQWDEVRPPKRARTQPRA